MPVYTYLELGKREKKHRILKKIAITVIFFVSTVYIPEICYAQEPLFTSNSETMLMSNPAFAGVNKQMNTYGIHKSQYFGMFQTTALGFDTRVKLFNKMHGVGVKIFQDDWDLVENLKINFIYSYRQSVWNGTIGYGLEVGFNNSVWTGELNVDSLKSEYGQELAGEYARYNQKVNGFKFDMGFGAFYKDDKLYLGASLLHLLRPEMPVTETEDVYLYVPRSFILAAGYTIVPVRRPDLEIKPSVFFRTHGNTLQAEALADIWFKKKFKGGLGLRFQESIFFTAGWKMKNGVYLGAAYDVVTNKIALGQPGFGSLEFLFKYSFDIDFDKKNYRYKSIRLL